MSSASAFAAKYGAKPTTTGSASADFAQRAKAGLIKPVAVAQPAPVVAPPTPPTFFEKAKQLAVSIGEKINPPQKSPVISKIDADLEMFNKDLINKQQIAIQSGDTKKADEYAKRVAKIQAVKDPTVPINKKYPVAIYEGVRREVKDLLSGAAVATTSTLLDPFQMIAERLEKGKIPERKPAIDNSGLPKPITSLLNQPSPESKPIANPIDEQLKVFAKKDTTPLSPKSQIFAAISEPMKKWAEEASPTNPTFLDAVYNGTGSMGAYILIGTLSGGGAKTMAFAESLSEASSVYLENRKNGKSVAESSANADKDFLANLVINYALNIFDTPKEKLKFIKKAIMNAGTEGTQEAFQQLASNLTTGKPAMDGVLESAGVGSILGGGASIFLPNGQTIEITGEATKEKVDTDPNVPVPPTPPSSSAKGEKEVTPVSPEQQKAGVEKLGTATDVFRGSATKKIDVSKPNGITGGESFTLDEATAQRFADKNKGTVQNYTISPDANVINHSTLEEMVGKFPIVEKVAEIQRLIKELQVDVIRFDVPKGTQGEAELRVVNQRVLTPKAVITKPQIQPTAKKEAVTPKQAVAPKTQSETDLVARIQSQLRAGNTKFVETLRTKVAGKASLMRSLEKAVNQAKRNIQMEKKAAPKKVVAKKVVETKVAPKLKVVEAKPVEKATPKAEQAKQTKVVITKKPVKATRPLTPAKKADKFMAVNEKIQGSDLVSNKVALETIRKYFTDKELSVEFVDNIQTFDGGTAWGKYGEGLVQFINDTAAKTPTHEAVHAYLDLFTTPAQKEAYIARNLTDLRKKLGKREVNKQIRIAQTQATKPGSKPVSLVAAARVYSEETIANDFINYVKTRDTKSPIRKFFDKVIRFARSIVDKSNIKNLYQDIIDQRRDVIKKDIAQAQEYFQAEENKFAVTTKTLNRIRQDITQEAVNKQTIEQYTRRQDVGKTDREMLLEALAEMPDGKVNVSEFIAKVEAKIMPIALSRSTTYNDYGSENLTPKTAEARLLSQMTRQAEFGSFKKDYMFETHIWDTPFRHGEGGHFKADFSNKKVSYEIREVKYPDSNDKVYIVVENGVQVNQENVNEVVATTSLDRSVAEQWIEDHSGDLEKKKSGLFGHSRTATTPTKKAKIEIIDKSIATNQKLLEDYLVKSKNYIKADVAIKKKKDVLLTRVNKSLNNMIDTLVERRQKQIKDVGSTETYTKKDWLEQYQMLDFGTIIDRYFESDSYTRDWGDGKGNYPKAKVYKEYTTKLFEGILTPEQLDLENNPRNFVDTVYRLENQVMTKERLDLIIRDIIIEPKERYGRFVTEQYEGLQKLNDIRHNLENSTDNDETVRHIMEIQSDPLQSTYEVTTEYTRAVKEVAYRKKDLKNRIADLERYTSEGVANLPRNEDQQRAYDSGLESLKENIRLAEEAVTKAEEDVAPAEQRRTPLEKQYFAALSKYHERAIKEEVRLAAQDLITDGVKEVKLRVPTPTTVSFIEGYLRSSSLVVENGSLIPEGMTPEASLQIKREKEVKALPMPESPLNLDEGQVAIYKTQEMRDSAYLIGKYVEANGELYQIIDSNMSEDSNRVVMEKAAEEYHFNQFDSTDSVDVGDTVTYEGSNYTVMAQNNDDTIDIAPSDRVNNESIEEYINEQVDGDIQEVHYELKNLASKYGEINSAEIATKILEEEKDKFDFYETEMVLTEMSEADPEEVLDPTDFEDKAREAIYERSSEDAWNVSYWEDMGYEHVSINDGYVTYMNEEGEYLTVDAPDSEYNVETNFSLSETEMKELQEKYLNTVSQSSKEYEEKMFVYYAEVDKIREKYNKQIEELKSKPLTADLNKLGEYNFNPETQLDSSDYRAVYRYYEREVLPFFRKFRKDATLVTDKNGIQWWETKVTEADKQAVEAYQRKTNAETLLDMANEIVKKEQVVIGKKKASLRPVEIDLKLRKSKAYARVVEQMDDEFKDQPFYNQMSIARDVANAMDFAKQHPDRAVKIAKGIELPPPNITDTAISIVAADTARESGDFKLWNDLETSRSLRQTRRGQEIVSERGRVTPNSPEYFLHKILQERKANVMAKKGWVYETKGKNKTTFAQGLSEQVAQAKKKVDTRTMNSLDSAQSILDLLTCK